MEEKDNGGIQRALNPYQVDPYDNRTYKFKTDTGVKYVVTLNITDAFFDGCCKTCNEIFEVVVQPDVPNPPNDQRTGDTLTSILESYLDQCKGVMYSCEDEDGKGDSRSRKFDIMIGARNQEKTFDIERHSPLGVELVLITRTDCPSSEAIKGDFKDRCYGCPMYQDDCYEEQDELAC